MERGTMIQPPGPTLPPLFEEVQRFDQWWMRAPFYLVMAVFLGVIAVISYVQLSEGAPPMPIPAWLGLVFGFAVAVGVPGLLMRMKLVIRLDPQNLTAHFWPFRRKIFPLAEIISWEARTYRPLRDFGGWGVRRSRSLGLWAYNVKGNEGVFIELVGGRKFMLGSQHAQELAAALESIKRG
jgi:hypothetical protein